MSRSYKKPVTGTLYKGPVCCIDDTTTKKWKKEYNRAMRRDGNQDMKELEKLDKEGIEDNEYALESKPDHTTHGNSWSDPADGRTLHDSSNSGGFNRRKEYHFKMK